jgi:hypothetical protein
VIAAATVVPAVGFAHASGAAEDAAKASCKNDGWQTLVRADQSPFKNQGECVSYAAKGGQPNTVCFDSPNPVMSFDFRLTGPLDTAGNATYFWSSDGSCSGGVLLHDTTVVASDEAQAASKCADIAGDGSHAFSYRPGYPTAPQNWWGCAVYV